MYTLFNNAPTVNRGALTFPHFNYVRGELQKNLDRVIGYYRVSPMYYPSNHLLVQILRHLNVSLQQELTMYRDKVEDLTDDLSRALQLTSPTSVGRIPRKGVFYGEGSDEVIISVDETFSLQTVREGWENLQPIRFLRHPKTDLNLAMPEGSQTSDELGLSVITLNIPMLACQFREWKLRELRDNPENPRNAMQFLGLYPIPNSLRSQVDVAYINRFIAHFHGETLPAIKDNHPFYLNNYEHRIDTEIPKIIDVIKRRAIPFENLLEALVPIQANSFREVIALPKMPYTRQVIWALTLARLPVVTFLVEYDAMTGRSRNGQELNRFRRSIAELRNDANLRQGLPPEVRDPINQEIDYLESLL